MVKICLVYPNGMKLPSYFKVATNISTDINETLPPLGLLYIISNSKYNIDFIDNRIEKYSFKELINRLMEYDIIGFGGTIFEIKEVRKTSQYLMQNGKITIYGGPNATVNWNLYLGYFNIIIRGEVEPIFDSLIENINNPLKLGMSNIKGSWINQEVFKVNNLDKLKFPDRTKIDLNKYRRTESAYLGDIYPVDTIVSSRGCPFNCYFCSSKIIWGQRYIYRSVDNVLNEIIFMKKEYGSKAIYFREDNFTTNKNRLFDFCKKVKKLNIIWMCESRVDTLDEEIIKQMFDSGCRGIWFGIESTDDEVLKKIRKNITLNQIKKTINLCNKYGITTGGGFMLGFPFDDKESIIKNYQSSKKLNLKVVFYNRIWAIPSSEMYDEIINNGLDYYSYENIILPSTKYLTADEVNDIYYKLVSKKELFIKQIIKILGKERTIFFKKRFPFLFHYLKRLLKL